MDPSPALRRKPPSLVELTIRSAIANLRYMGDVGDTDPDLLAQILPHATLAQLTHIEDSSVGRDLSNVTDPLWKRFYKNEFGEDCVDLVLRRMEQHGVYFSWSRLFKTKKEEREQFQEKTMERTRLLFAEEKAKAKDLGPPWLLFISESGHGKRVPISEFRLSKFRKMGLKSYKLLPESSLAAVFVVGASLTEDGESDEQVVLVSQSGTVNRIKVRDISIQSRFASMTSLDAAYPSPLMLSCCCSFNQSNFVQ